MSKFMARLGTVQCQLCPCKLCASRREIALRFLGNCEDFWMPPIDEKYLLPFTDSILSDDADDFDCRL
jgi:hypothetical protein